MKRRKRLWLVVIWGDIEPGKLRGPFKTDAARVRAARKLGTSDEDGVYRIDSVDRPRIETVTMDERCPLEAI